MYCWANIVSAYCIDRITVKKVIFKFGNDTYR